MLIEAMEISRENPMEDAKKSKEWMKEAMKISGERLMESIKMRKEGLMKP
jgi:hypothetical protein